MAALPITLSKLKEGISRYIAGERPWPESLNKVDWFISFEGELYPLKYTYALSLNISPRTYHTGSMKRAMRDLQLSFHSLKAETDRHEKFEKKVIYSLNDPIGRLDRLKTARKKPARKYLVISSFVRNTDVVAEVLDRANGICESCGKPAPFRRASDNSPYLEVHHKVFLAKGGDDVVENAEALCPNCHRQKHYG